MIEASRVMSFFLVLAALSLGVADESRADQMSPEPDRNAPSVARSSEGSAPRDILDSADAATDAARPVVIPHNDPNTAIPAKSAAHPSDSPAPTLTVYTDSGLHLASPAPDRPRINTVVWIERDPARLNKKTPSSGKLSGKGATAVLKQLLQRYGKRGPLGLSGAVATPSSGDATSLNDLNQALADQNLSTRTLETDMFNLTKLAHTHDVICLFSSDDHYVLIQEINDHEVMLYHPGWAKTGHATRSLPRHEFERQWAGRVCLLIDGRLPGQ